MIDPTIHALLDEIKKRRRNYQATAEEQCIWYELRVTLFELMQEMVIKKCIYYT